MGNPKGKAIRWLVITALLIFWGIMGLIWVNSSKTCAETAVQIFRLSSLLTYAFYVLVFSSLSRAGWSAWTSSAVASYASCWCSTRDDKCTAPRIFMVRQRAADKIHRYTHAT